ncbi:hypothetical protein [Burkholderia anthina]|uniref:Lipoprotein n=1 Tax=Burkholderia anthina TaxID=179879 RepID=A0A6P2GFR4_9BURK|nr:hypothetical protein [Burkholderia anthina]MBM2769894.1 hypothetical protein [Burkholderia anthina]VVU51869.1 hypothetical protein BAN20980_04592 [Burkholderia anthina]
MGKVSKSIARVSFALLCAAALAAGPAKAKKPQKGHERTWTKEPDGFLGFKFGEPFPDSGTLPDCPKDGSHTDYSAVFKMSSMCFDGYGRSSYGTIWNTPKLGFGYEVNVMISDGKPVTFVLATKPENFSQLADVLIQRYGPPSQSKTGTVQNGAGATFDNQSLKWIGKKVTINAEMRSGTVDQSKVFISDRAYWDARQSEQDQAAKSGADQL